MWTTSSKTSLLLVSALEIYMQLTKFISISTECLQMFVVCAFTLLAFLQMGALYKVSFVLFSPSNFHPLPSPINYCLEMEKGKITRNITEELQSSFFLSVFKFSRLKLYLCMYSPRMSNTTDYNSACYNVTILKSAARVRLNQTLLPTS